MKVEEAKSDLAEKIKAARQKLEENPEMLKVSEIPRFRSADEQGLETGPPYFRFGCY